MYKLFVFDRNIRYHITVVGWLVGWLVGFMAYQPL